MKHNINISIIFIIILLLCVPNLSSIAVEVKDSNEKIKVQKVIVQINHHGDVQDLIVKKPIIELSLEEVEQLKNRFLDLEKSYSGSEKIKEQLKILREIDAIPSEFNLELLISIMEKMKNNRFSPSSFFGFNRVTGGPMIISHLTLNNRIKCILPIREPTFYFHIINKSGFDGYAGILPLFCGYSFNPVFVTAFGPNIPNSFSKLYFNFFEFLLPCIGVSIAFIVDSDNNSKDVIFEYNIDVCLIGTFRGFAF